jgi:hypothetical protein
MSRNLYQPASGGIGQTLARRLAADRAVLGLGYGANGQAAKAPAARSPRRAFPRKRIVHVFTSRLGGTSRTAVGAMKILAHALSTQMSTSGRVMSVSAARSGCSVTSAFR